MVTLRDPLVAVRVSSAGGMPARRRTIDQAFRAVKRASRREAGDPDRRVMDLDFRDAV
jgi:hypothetical protein